MRNKINHADDAAMAELRLAVAESDESLAFIRMKDCIDYFIESYEKAVQELEGKKPNVVKTTSAEVKQWAETIRREERNEREERDGKNGKNAKNEKRDNPPLKKEPGPVNHPRRRNGR